MGHLGTKDPGSRRAGAQGFSAPGQQLWGSKVTLEEGAGRTFGHCGFTFDTCADSKKAKRFSLTRVSPGEETLFSNNYLPGPQSSPLGNMRDILGSKKFFFRF